MKMVWKRIWILLMSLMLVSCAKEQEGKTQLNVPELQSKEEHAIVQETDLHANDSKKSVLDVPTQKKIKEAVLEKLRKDNPESEFLKELTAEEIPIRDYYGQYHGRDVFTTYLGEPDEDHPFYGESTAIEIGGISFEFENVFAYPYQPEFLAWEEGSLLTVEEAFYKDELKYSDIYRIAKLRGDLSEKYRPIYVDVDWDEDWFSDYVFEVSMRRSYIDGIDEEHFGPYEVLSRVQFVQVLVRMGGEPYYDTVEPFEDVTEQDAYAKEVSWAYRAGIVADHPDHMFWPNERISREQMAVMLYAYATHKGYDTTIQADLSGFADADQVSGYARDAMCWCVGNGMFCGNEGRLSPLETVTKAECTAVLYRFLEYIEK